MALNIIADENMAGVLQYMGGLGEVRLVNGRALQHSDLCDTDVLLVRSVTAVDERLLDGTPVRFVGTATSGLDHIDRQYLTRQGIAFAHAPGANANSVVEYVLAVISAVDGKLEQLLNGGTLGIIGYGHIGKLLAGRLGALGISYRVFDPWLDPGQICHPADLEQVLGCDVLSVHAELTEKQPWPSYHLLGESELCRLGDNALLINASRGEVVDTVALNYCLRNNASLTAILDVWEGEPAVPEGLLSRVKFGTAHIAGYSLDGKLRATQMLQQAIQEHFNTAVVNNLDNKPDMTSPLQLPGQLSGPALLRALLQHNYDPRVDDQLLRDATLGQPVAQARVNFDRLRKGYRKRTELFGKTVDVDLQHADDLHIIEALGCEHVDSGLRGPARC